LKLLKSAADKGSADASLVYGQHLIDGKLCPQNEEQGLYYLRWSADSGNSMGEFVLGNALRSKGLSEGDEYLEQSAEHGNALAQVQLAWEEYNDPDGDPDRFARFAKMAADQGEPLGYFGYAIALAFGVGVPRDLTAANRYLCLAGDYGTPSEKCMVAKIFTELTQLPDNLALAAKYYKAAADDGDADGCREYALLEAAGHGVQLSAGEDARDYKFADDEGLSCDTSGDAKYISVREGIHCDLAARYYKMAPQIASPSHTEEDAERLLLGDGVPQDFDAAVHYFKSAAESRDSSDGKDHYFKLCSAGNRIPQKSAEAARYYRMRANTRSPTLGALRAADAPPWRTSRTH
jgi:TPR repeat protein